MLNFIQKAALQFSNVEATSQFQAALKKHKMKIN
jgi:hypothetical protein